MTGAETSTHNPAAGYRMPCRVECWKRPRWTQWPHLSSCQVLRTRHQIPPAIIDIPSEAALNLTTSSNE